MTSQDHRRLFRVALSALCDTARFPLSQVSSELRSLARFISTRIDEGVTEDSTREEIAKRAYAFFDVTNVHCGHVPPDLGEACSLCGYIRKRGWTWSKNQPEPPKEIDTHA